MRFDRIKAACKRPEQHLRCAPMASGPTAQFLSMKEIVAELGVSYDSFRRKIARGEGPKFKRYGTRILIRKDWYKSWLEEDDQ